MRFFEYLRKPVVPVLAAAMFFLLRCTGPGIVNDPNSIAGKWDISIERNGTTEYYEFEFTEKDGRFTGVVNSYVNGARIAKARINSIDYVHPDIDMLTNENANIRYTGTVDLEENIISGNLIYADGSMLEFNLTRAESGNETDNDPAGYVYRIPENTGDGWETASLSNACIQREPIDALYTGIERGEYGAVDAFLIMRNDRLVFEEYRFGNTLDNLHFISSNSKSVSGLIFGTLVDRGFVPDLDADVFDYFPEYTQFRDRIGGTLTVRHVLQMRGGYETAGYEFRPGADMFAAAFDRNRTAAPGERFEYDNALPNLLAGIVKQATGKHIDEWAEEHFFGPLDILNYDWSHETAGEYPVCQGTLQLLPRDMVKIGSLIVNDGMYNGKRILSSEWMRDTVRKHSTDTGQSGFCYGYLWWIYRYALGGAEFDVVYAGGSGGQFIFTIPDLKMVVVFTGSGYESSDHLKLMGAMRDIVIPAVLGKIVSQ